MYRSRKTTKAYNPKAKKVQYKSAELACPFCELGDRKVYYRGTTMLVVQNLFPYDYWDYYGDVTDHLLLIPKRHVDSLARFTDEEKIEAVNIMAEYEANGYNIYGRSQENSSRSVPHQHTHLIRTNGKQAKLSIHSEKPYFVWKV